MLNIMNKFNQADCVYMRPQKAKFDEIYHVSLVKETLFFENKPVKQQENRMLS